MVEEQVAAVSPNSSSAKRYGLTLSWESRDLGSLRLRHRRRRVGGLRAGDRLTEDPSVKALLLEAGGWDRNPWIHIPLGWPRLFLHNDGEVCGGERIKGANCATGGCAVTVYAVKELLKKKQSGQTIEAPRQREPSKAINLMDALRRSVETEAPVANDESPREPRAIIERQRRQAGRVRGRRKPANISA
jgi:hypothetical protein